MIEIRLFLQIILPTKFQKAKHLPLQIRLRVVQAAAVRELRGRGLQRAGPACLLQQVHGPQPGNEDLLGAKNHRTKLPASKTLNGVHFYSARLDL
jgi:hypothetical protein